MITEILHNCIKEVDGTRFVISEFQLGEEPLKLLVDEVVGQVEGFKHSPDSMTFCGIPITKHDSEDAVMFCLGLKIFNAH